MSIMNKKKQTAKKGKRRQKNCRFLKVPIENKNLEKGFKNGNFFAVKFKFCRRITIIIIMEQKGQQFPQLI